VSGIESLLNDCNKRGGVVHKVLKWFLRNEEQVCEGREKNLRPGMLKNEVLSVGGINEGRHHNRQVSALVLYWGSDFQLHLCGLPGCLGPDTRFIVGDVGMGADLQCDFGKWWV